MQNRGYHGGRVELLDGDRMGFKFDMDYNRFVGEDQLSRIHAYQGEF